MLMIAIWNFWLLLLDCVGVAFIERRFSLLILFIIFYTLIDLIKENYIVKEL
jgi:hypothetical protein